MQSSQVRERVLESEEEEHQQSQLSEMENQQLRVSEKGISSNALG